MSTQVASPSPEKPKPLEELFVPGLYFADPNPEHSFEEGEADFIPLPTSSPIKYLPTQTQKGKSFIPYEESIDEEEELPTHEKSELADVKPKEPVGPPLSPQQQEVLNKVIRGENVFFTGSAG